MALKVPIRCALLLLATAVVAPAQTLPRLDGGVPQPAPAASGWKAIPPTAQSNAATPAPTADPLQPSAPQPPTPADMPAVPATVHFQNGLLAVHASNSSLTQILHDITTQTGMEVQGTPQDERVFGDFGPAPVGKVVAQLLDGGPSNYLLFGMAANHAPRSLILSPKTTPAPATLASGGAPVPTPTASDDDDDDDAPQAQAPIRPFQPAAMAAPDNQQLSPGIRTPQQILEDMQRRRQEQQQIQPQ